MDSDTTLSDLVSSFSLISDVSVSLPSNESGWIAITECIGSNLPSGLKSLRRHISGKGWSFEGSYKSFIGELIERSCAHESNIVEYELFRPRDLRRNGARFISPKDLLRDNLAFLEDGATIDSIDEQEFAFVRGAGFLSRKDVHVPAGCIFWGKGRLDVETQKVLRYATTTSGACSQRSQKLAGVGAFEELIERHDFMTLWLSVQKLDDVAKFETFTGAYYVGKFNSLTNNFGDYTTYVAFYLSKIEPRFFMGCSSSFDSNRALLGVTSEVNQQSVFIRLFQNDARRKNLEKRVDIANNLGHDLTSNGVFYATNEGFLKIENTISQILSGYNYEKRFTPNEYFGYLDQLRKLPRADEDFLKNKAAGLCKSLEIDPILVNIGNSMTSNLGVCVSRCFCLDLIPLTLPAHMPFSHPSLSRFPNLNRLIHPFM
jgi:hypothetical protein